VKEDELRPVDLYTSEEAARVKADEFGLRLPDPGKLEPDADGKRQLILLETLQMFEAKGVQHYHELARRNLARWASQAQAQPNGACQIEVVAGDWGEVTLACTKKYGKRFAALNMANADTPGGAYTEGKVAQEENMFRRTDCHFSIVRATFMKPDGSESYTKYYSDLLNGQNGEVYLDTASPRVCIRGKEDRNQDSLGYDHLPDDDVFPFYELRAAAVDYRNGAEYDHDETKRRVAAQLKTLTLRGVRHVVLSAFGCGAFMNPAVRVASAYHEALRERHSDFDVVVFAIFNAGYGPDNVSPFREEFEKWSVQRAHEPKGEPVTVGTPPAPAVAPAVAPAAADLNPALAQAPALAEQKYEPEVIEVCCGTDITQVTERMHGCEDYEHDIAANYAYWKRLATGKALQSSLDGIVRVSHRGGPYVANERSQIIIKEPDFISDHNAVRVNVDVTWASAQWHFNIITHNLEGMCAKMSRAERVRQLLNTWYLGHIQRGTLMVIQELALQEHKTDAKKQSAFLNENKDTLLSALRAEADAGCDLQCETDGYTGCMVYDASAWEHVHTEQIRRPGDANKKSNAYLMKHKEGGFEIWLVNVHLKAFGGLYDILFSENRERDEAHVGELRNIIDTLMRSEHGDLKVTPIYLCGDFNNPKSKRNLVKLAVDALKDYTLQEEEFVSAPSFGATRPRRCRKGRSRKLEATEKKAPKCHATRTARGR
jgi:hypothetical protein